MLNLGNERRSCTALRLGKSLHGGSTWCVCCWYTTRYSLTRAQPAYRSSTLTQHRHLVPAARRGLVRQIEPAATRRCGQLIPLFTRSHTQIGGVVLPQHEHVVWPQPPRRLIEVSVDHPARNTLRLDRPLSSSQPLCITYFSSPGHLLPCHLLPSRACRLRLLLAPVR